MIAMYFRSQITKENKADLYLSLACYLLSFVAGIFILGFVLILLGSMAYLLSDSRRVKQAALFTMLGALSGIGLSLLLFPMLRA